MELLIKECLLPQKPINVMGIAWTNYVFLFVEKGIEQFFSATVKGTHFKYEPFYIKEDQIINNTSPQDEIFEKYWKEPSKDMCDQWYNYGFPIFHNSGLPCKGPKFNIMIHGQPVKGG